MADSGVVWAERRWRALPCATFACSGADDANKSADLFTADDSDVFGLAIDPQNSKSKHKHLTYIISLLSVKKERHCSFASYCSRVPRD